VILKRSKRIEQQALRQAYMANGTPAHMLPEIEEAEDED